MTPNAAHSNSLQTDGFVVIENFFDEQLRNALRSAVDSQFQYEGENAGIEFRQESGSGRLANLVNKGAVFRRLVTHHEQLQLVRTVLGPDIKLSSLNARRAIPQNGTRQPLHTDMGAVPDEEGAWVCNCVWMLDDFTEKNGALRVIPGSHIWGTRPQDVLDDPTAFHPKQQLITGPAGTLVAMNAHTWHGGMENATDRPRTAVHAFFTRSDKPQQQFQKKLLSADVIAQLTPEERTILAIDDARNDMITENNRQRSGFLT